MKLGLRTATFFTGTTLAALIGVTGVGSQACTVTVNDGTFDGGGFDFPDTSPPPAATDACSRCLYTQCSGLHAYCESNAECLAIYNCAVQPGADVNVCFNQHPTGKAAYYAFALCDQRNACTSCGATCEGNAAKPSANVCARDYPVTTTPDSGTPEADAGTTTPDAGTTTPQPTACDTCLATNCAAQQAACGAGSDCAANHECIQGCVAGAPDKLSECFDACGSVHTEGKTAGDALGTCTSQQCSAQCF